ncbi:hypothetical protein BD310DRAFT_831342 [Dichomitus squalens]|uniref:DUF6533 domain-containing protein n=1 Tax=Dichomitus squalens TaxID=114155 RepID=A0A4Q9PH61_9APHY|nr:hypothetical protein BD310DRAFT_831342 [Dichomitus squalens]
MSSTHLPDSYLDALDIGKESRAGALALLVYDHLVTLDLEAELVWTQSKRSRVVWLYIFNRFFPLVWLVCIIYLSVDDFVILVSTLAVQIILQLRVYALYDKGRRVRLFLVCCWLAEVTVMAILIGITMANISGKCRWCSPQARAQPLMLVLADLPVVSTPTGCYYSGIFSISALFWLPALVYEPILCLMVLWQAWDQDWTSWFRRAVDRSGTSVRLHQGRLFKVLARDSLIYFVAIFIELIINTVIWSHYNRYINIVVPWAGVLPSILGSRLLLSMREAIRFSEQYGPHATAITNLAEDRTAASSTMWFATVDQMTIIPRDKDK